MALKISIVLLFTLFTAGRSLKCYQCVGVVGSCVSAETTCQAGATKCASATVVSSVGTNKVNMQVKGCDVPQNCVNGSINFGVSRTAMSMQCCDTDLCNNRDVPDLSSSSPNGKRCFFCDGKTCLNTLDCLGNEDYCISAKGTSEVMAGTVKGCASKSICDAASKEIQGFIDISCCQGNLCNSAESITQSFLLLSWLFFSYILFH